MTKVLVVGAGLTGSLVSCLLSRAPNFSITVWEKETWVGGRTYTYKDPSSGLHLNMGAQYISRSNVVHPQLEYKQLKDELYADLLSNEVIVPHTGIVEGVNLEHQKQVFQNYTTPQGFSSITDHFLSRSAVDLKLDHNLTEVVVNTSQGSPTINCSCSNNNDTYDVVILTMPAPSLLQLKGNLFEAMEKSKLSSLSSVTYSPRYALGLFYKDSVPRTNWTSKYFTADSNKDEDGDVVVRYISWGSREMRCMSSDSSLLVHSGIEFAAKHAQTGSSAVQSKMQQALDSLIPGLPIPSHSKLMWWQHARCDRIPAYHDTPGCLVLSRDPLLVATGDGLCDSNFESCIKAALATVQTIKRLQSTE